MEAPDYRDSAVKQLEDIIERFVPKLFYKWNYSFEKGLMIYVPKKYMNIIEQHLKDSNFITTLRYKILDIAKEV